MGDFSFECSLELLKGVERNNTYLQSVNDAGHHINLTFATIDSEGRFNFSFESIRKVYHSYLYIEDEMYKTIIAIIKKENPDYYEQIVREGNELMDKKVTVDIHRFSRILGLACVPLSRIFYLKSGHDAHQLLYVELTILCLLGVYAGIRSSIHFNKEKKELKLEKEIRERKLEIERKRIFKEL